MTAPSRVRPAEVGHSAFTRRTLVKGAAWATPVAAFSLSAPAMAASFSCGTTFDTQARGRLLSGQILGVNLDSIAELEGVHAQALAPALEDTESGPLSVEVLSALDLELGGLAGLLTSLLDSLTNQNAGIANQYAHANAEAGTGPASIDVGSSGAVNDATGAIDFQFGNEGPPRLASIDLHSLLTQLGGDGVAGLIEPIAGLNLDIGAVAGIAELDGVCSIEDGGVEVLRESVERDHRLAYLRLVTELDLVGELLASLQAVTIDTTAITAGLKDVLQEVLGGAGGLVGQLLAALLDGTVTARVTLNTAALTDGSIPGDNAALQLGLGEGVVVVDVASVLGGAYVDGVTEYFNQLGPNTRLFADAHAPTVPVADFVGALVQDVLARLYELIDIDITVSTLGLAELTIRGTLAQLLAGQGTVAARLNVLLGWVEVPLGALVAPVLTAVGELVKTTVDGVLGTGTDGLVANALGGLNVVLENLFQLLSGVVALTVNAQNDETGAVPAYFAAITPEGRYDVAALHVALLEALDPAVPSGLLNLSLGRGSVGESAPRPA